MQANITIGATAYTITPDVLERRFTEAVYGVGGSLPETTLRAVYTLVANTMRAHGHYVNGTLDWNQAIGLLEARRYTGLKALTVSRFGIITNGEVTALATEYVSKKIEELEGRLSKPFPIEEWYLEVGATSLYREQAQYARDVDDLKALKVLVDSNEKIERAQKGYQERLERLNGLVAKTKNETEFRSALESLYKKINTLVDRALENRITRIEATSLQDISPSKAWDRIQKIEVLIAHEEESNRTLLAALSDLRQDLAADLLAPAHEIILADFQAFEEWLLSPLAQLKAELSRLQQRTHIEYPPPPPAPLPAYLAPPKIPVSFKGSKDPAKRKLLELLTVCRTPSALYRLAIYPETFYAAEELFIELFPPKRFAVTLRGDYCAAREEFFLVALMRTNDEVEDSLKISDQDYAAALRQETSQPINEARRKAITRLVTGATFFPTYKHRLQERAQELSGVHTFRVDGNPVSFIEWALAWIRIIDKTDTLSLPEDIAHLLTNEDQKNYFMALYCFPAIIWYLLENGLIDEASTALSFFGYHRAPKYTPSAPDQKLTAHLNNNISGEPPSTAYLDHAKISLSHHEGEATQATLIVDPNKTESDSELIPLMEAPRVSTSWFPEFLKRLRLIYQIDPKRPGLTSRVVRLVDFIARHSMDPKCQWMWRDITGIIMSNPQPKDAREKIAKWIVSNKEILIVFDSINDILRH